MTSPQMARLDEHLQRLRLNTVRERVEALLQEASEKELSYADFLDGLLSEEVSAKTAKHVTMRTNLARFPFIKGLDSFDFTYQPSVDRKQIQKLSLCHRRWIRRRPGGSAIPATGVASAAPASGTTTTSMRTTPRPSSTPWRGG